MTANIAIADSLKALDFNRANREEEPKIAGSALAQATHKPINSSKGESFFDWPRILNRRFFARREAASSWERVGPYRLLHAASRGRRPGAL